MQQLDVDGANLISGWGRLAFIADVIADRRTSTRLGWSGAHPILVDVRDWPQLVADPDASEHLAAIAEHGAGLGVTIRLHGISSDDAARAADEADLPAVAAAVRAGGVFNVAGADAPIAYTVRIEPDGMLSGVDAVPIEHRRHVADGLRRAAEMLAPSDGPAPR